MPTEENTLQSLLERSSRAYGDAPALSYIQEEPVAFRSVRDQALSLAKFLAKLGTEKGDRVAILSENMPNWGIVYFAVAAAGGVIVPILPDFPADDIMRILDHSGAKVLFASEKLAGKCGDIPKSSVMILQIDSLSDYIRDIPPRWDDMRFVTPEDTAAIIYTSGTTGTPKGVMLSHGNLMSNTRAAAPIPNMKQAERLLSILPLSHTYECTIGFLIPFMLGACVYYIKKPPTPSVLRKALDEVKPGVMLSVPLLIEKIYRQNIRPVAEKNAVIRALFRIPPFRLLLSRIVGKRMKAFFGGRVYFFGVGGAPLAPDVERFLRDAGFPYAIGYGMTETSPLIAGDNAKNTRFRSTGRILEGIQVAILHPDESTGEGEIVVKGPNVMQGYYRDPERTSEVFTEDGWLKTGDLGTVNRKGYLYIKGRSKNLILGPGGENVYPETIENLINSFPYVEESLVFAHEGQIIARIQLNYESLEEHLKSLKEGAEELAEYAAKHLSEIRRVVNSRLSHFSRLTSVIEQKIPFEKTPTKKIKRFLYTLDAESGNTV